MKKLINGKMYNTETAEEIATWSNSYYSSDFRYCQETLYKTKKGAYFLHGTGGPLSSYSQPVGNNGRGGGSEIIAYTADQAFDWLEEHDLTEEAEKEFPGKIEEA